MLEKEMVGCHHQLNGHEYVWTPGVADGQGFERTPGVGDGRGSLACFGSWGCKESDMTERLN